MKNCSLNLLQSHNFYHCWRLTSARQHFLYFMHTEKCQALCSFRYRYHMYRANRFTIIFPFRYSGKHFVLGVLSVMERLLLLWSYALRACKDVETFQFDSSRKKISFASYNRVLKQKTWMQINRMKCVQKKSSTNQLKRDNMKGSTYNGVCRE